jgi:N-methylhydantoinase A
VVEDETTTFVPAGFEARRSRLGSLVLDDIAAAGRGLSTDKETAV